MIAQKHEIFLTVVLFVVMILLLMAVRWTVKKFSRLRAIDINRIKIIINLCYLVVYLLSGAFLAIIWGVDMPQFTVFISSILAVLGIGFFAQWSILSNLTSSVILFFNHPVRIGDRIKVLDKDFNWMGKVTNITGFYLFLTTDSGEKITLPTSMVMQKGIQMIDEEAENVNEIDTYMDEIDNIL
jgi:small-conductance mechanosensitive channel